MPTNLEIRAAAVEATIAEWRDRPFKLGKNDCWKLADSCLKKQGIAIPRSGKVAGYKSPLSARAELKRLHKVGSVAELLDKFFKRITPAAMLPGDLVQIPGLEDHGQLGAIGIYVGNETIFCYVEDHETPQGGKLTYEEGSEPITAWRTLP